MALRQTQGFMDLIIQIMKAELAIPDYGTISKSSINLPKHVLDKQPAARIVIPPHKTGICSATGDSQRDGHIRTIKQQGRIAWQKKTNYGLRSYVELAIQRYKRIFGNTLKARALRQQKTEAWIAASALNRMTNLGMPVSVKI
jgi:hypothetical protein